jgi:hypothetical protein
LAENVQAKRYRRLLVAALLSAQIDGRKGIEQINHEATFEMRTGYSRRLRTELTFYLIEIFGFYRTIRALYQSARVMRRTFPRRRRPSTAQLDLPPSGWTNWGARTKAAVVLAIRIGTLGRQEAYDRYLLSEEELASWEAAFDQGGIGGLQRKGRRRTSKRSP